MTDTTDPVLHPTVHTTLLERVIAVEHTAKQNSHVAAEVRETLREHVSRQSDHFRDVHTKIEMLSRESTAQHAELGGKVMTFYDKWPTEMETALRPLATEIGALRSWQNKLMLGAMAGLITVIGYLLIYGPPWMSVMTAHAEMAH